MFWIVKICATTVGETGGDAVSMSLKLGYAAATSLFLVYFAVALTAQVRARRYHPLPYWLLVVATTTVGTTTSDFIDRSLHLGYVVSSAGLLALVLILLVSWRLVCGRIASDHVLGGREEVFYWVTILASNTLGTALGDFAADDEGLNLGFERGALMFGAVILVIAGLSRLKAAPKTLLFWAAYVLTRPLGATLGDTLTKGRDEGGFGLDRFLATGTIAGVMVLLIFAAAGLRNPSVAAPRPTGGTEPQT